VAWFATTTSGSVSSRSKQMLMSHARNFLLWVFAVTKKPSSWFYSKFGNLVPEVQQTAGCLPGKP
jgi:hypothetical protein